MLPRPAFGLRTMSSSTTRLPRPISCRISKASQSSHSISERLRFSKASMNSLVIVIPCPFPFEHRAGRRMNERSPSIELRTTDRPARGSWDRRSEKAWVTREKDLAYAHDESARTSTPCALKSSSAWPCACKIWEHYIQVYEARGSSVNLKTLARSWWLPEIQIPHVRRY